jgi:glutamyl-tRNA synthetase
MPVPGAFLAENFEPDAFRALAPMVQERAKVLSETPFVVDFLFAEPVVDEAAWTKTMQAPGSVEMLDGVLAAMPDTPWSHEDLKGLVERVGEANGLKLGKAQAPIRVALTGRTVGPPLFEAMEVLGRDRAVRRLIAARAKL